jgi:putative restriction endonuclease
MSWYLEQELAMGDRVQAGDQEQVEGCRLHNLKQLVHFFGIDEGWYEAILISAYAIQCAVCRLRQRELSEAAHILSDTDPRGPIIPNGLAMCSLHHTAYDTNVVGISPDYVIHVGGDVLHERDGPMLQHGLQGFEQKSLLLLKRHDERPDRGCLEERFDEFKRAG